MRSLNSSKTLEVTTLIVAAVLLQSSLSNGANILGLFTSSSPSHFIVHMSVVKALAEKGHNITVVSSEEPKVTHPSIKHIVIPPTEQERSDLDKGMSEMATQRNTIFNLLKNMLTSVSTIITLQANVLRDERFKRLYDQKFDLVIVGYFFNDYQLGVAAKFNCPVIISWMSTPISAVGSFVGNPSEVAYVPLMNIATKPGEVMGFLQRAQNFFSTGIFKIFHLTLTQLFKSYYRELFPSENFPSYDDMHKNVSLLFCNSHFSDGFVQPTVPAIVEIGGIQIKDKPEPLPKDIAEFLDNAQQDGGILFSLGSNLKGSNIKPDTVKIIFKTLSSLKQKIIWKWEDLKNVPGKSPNILYKKWLPQDDILAHPNLKLFITHAGKGGLAEAQYHGVPMVALPVFADQHGNAMKMELSGYGKQLDMLSLTELEFKNGILEVLNNPKYKANVQRFSELYQDRPLTAKQSVVFWTEYVLRHHGANHMQSPLIHLNTFQTLLLDVIGALVIGIYVVIKLLRTIFRLICNKLFKKSKIVGKKQNLKNKTKKQ